MSYLYVSEQGAKISISGNRFVVKSPDGMERSIPAYPMEVIQIFGNVQMTTQCMEECLKSGVTVSFYSTSGAYYGRLVSTSHVNVARQRLQARRSDDPELRLAFAKSIISAKIQNQIVMLRRYARNHNVDVSSEIHEMERMKRLAQYKKDTEELMGCEGFAARNYFNGLAKVIDPAFAFNGRNRRPPKDPFNSMISLGYSILLNEIYGQIEAKGMNAYFGMLHADREKHPTLASDLMEEWRAVIVDSTVLSMINGHEIFVDDFEITSEGGVALGKKAFKEFITKLDKKLTTDARYLKYLDSSVSFRRAIDCQIDRFIRVLETGDISEYQPIILR